MSKFKIEKASHYVSTIDNFIVSSYMPVQDKITNISFYSKENAVKSSSLNVGVWRLKYLNGCKTNKELIDKLIKEIGICLN